MQVRCTKDGALMPARKPRITVDAEQAQAELERLGTAAEAGLDAIDRGPGPDQAETRASRWDTPRST